MLLHPGIASAADYPLMVTDMAGRQVTIAAAPKRIALQDGRTLLDLALLDRKNPFARVVVWNNFLRRSDQPFWSVIAQKFPQAAAIPDMGFGDNGQVNLEEIIAQKPDLLIAEARAQPALAQAGVMRILASLKIPVVFIDDADKPVPDAAASVTLLGKILDRTAEAQAYTDFYAAHLAHLQTTIAAIPGPHPTVFIEALAGQNDSGGCCFTHGDFGWGLLVQELGAQNLGTSLLRTPAGMVSMETLLADQPGVFVMTGKSPGGPEVPGFGYGASPAQLDASMAALESRTGFSALNAVRQNRVFGIYHAFYNSAYNIVGLEFLAQFIYPRQFAGLDPDATYNALITQFTDLPAAPVIMGRQAVKFAP